MAFSLTHLLFLFSILTLSLPFSCNYRQLPLPLSHLPFTFNDSHEMRPNVGICYGELGNNLPDAKTSVGIIQKLNATRLKIYGTNPDILKSIRDKNLQISIMLPNELIPNISANQTLADNWVEKNVKPFFPKSKIRYLLVGNEILSNQPNTTWFQLVPAMRRIRKSIKQLGLKKIKIGTPLGMDCLASSYPPSSGAFREDLSESVFRPLLSFLNRTKSFFFVDVYTYFAWASQPLDINLDYALLQSTNIKIRDPVSNLTYTNLLDQMLDALHFAMNRIGYSNVRLFVAETGWPNGGDRDQLGANVHNAATYNRNVVRKLTRNPPLGTPALPGAVIPAMIFALYNENNKTGPGTERHFGLMYPNGTGVYHIDLSGKTEYPDLTKPESNRKLWCVVVNTSNKTALNEALNFACANGTCGQIGRACVSLNLVNKTSYAFSSYWVRNGNRSSGTCSFHGVVGLTSKDPSLGSCNFPSVNL